VSEHTSSTPETYPEPAAIVINTWPFPFVFKESGGGISGVELSKQQEAFLFLFLCFHKGSLNILNFWLASVPEALSLGFQSSVGFLYHPSTHSSKVVKERDSKEKVALPFQI
jgi:hypothetical protein